ncbi:MAG: thymidylate synthase, thymidylate synthase [Microgenomates group bacterium GW2011_GWC1_37_12b]|uniref:Thymidylate synthase n=1 Tax=Candidatus Woesebacteria bacterium GW2011_GWB1_38_8b TaxID=1618571 RepID=A0A0G0PAT9_9BACT|nr:MAG: thymidylate synthase, thymidylate synthase [Microgenomates group bacterium GW2011_GWC1_37_12b]KKQ86416.1 MAG: Thymidylate synthase [Candidatus Woesebacteria bacterium GW2011_GWB1_38_8b]
MKSKKIHPEYQYLELLKELVEKGVVQKDINTGVKTYSKFGAQLRFDLSEGFPLLTTKKVWWKGVLYELYWFLTGQSNIKFLVDNDIHIWDDYPYKIYREKIAKGKLPDMSKEEFIEKIKTNKRYAEKYGNLPNIYGELWRRWPAKGRTIDQVEWVINEIKNDPDAHNLIVNSWNPEYLYGMAKPQEASRFPICHNLYQLNVKNGRVCLHLYQRSADIFLGVPFNIASYALLTLIFARVTGYEPGEFIHSFGDVHIYENHLEQAREQLKRKPKKFPIVIINPKVKKLTDLLPEHITLENYNPHPPIKAELTVSGGYFAKGQKPNKFKR